MSVVRPAFKAPPDSLPRHITYGDRPQSGDRPLDACAHSASPPPVVVMIHGGCWTASPSPPTPSWTGPPPTSPARGVAVMEHRISRRRPARRRLSRNLSRRGGGRGQAGRRGRPAGSSFRAFRRTRPLGGRAPRPVERGAKRRLPAHQPPAHGSPHAGEGGDRHCGHRQTSKPISTPSAAPIPSTL